jgi:hypothetical protein
VQRPGAHSLFARLASAAPNGTARNARWQRGGCFHRVYKAGRTAAARADGCRCAGGGGGMPHPKAAAAAYLRVPSLDGEGVAHLLRRLRSDLIRSDLIVSYPIRSGLIRSGPILSYPNAIARPSACAGVRTPQHEGRRTGKANARRRKAITPTRCHARRPRRTLAGTAHSDAREHVHARARARTCASRRERSVIDLAVAARVSGDLAGVPGGTIPDPDNIRRLACNMQHSRHAACSSRHATAEFRHATCTRQRGTGRPNGPCECASS